MSVQVAYCVDRLAPAAPAKAPNKNNFDVRQRKTCYYLTFNVDERQSLAAQNKTRNGIGLERNKRNVCTRRISQRVDMEEKIENAIACDNFRLHGDFDAQSDPEPKGNRFPVIITNTLKAFAGREEGRLQHVRK